MEAVCSSETLVSPTKIYRVITQKIKTWILLIICNLCYSIRYHILQPHKISSKIVVLHTILLYLWKAERTWDVRFLRQWKFKLCPLWYDTFTTKNVKIKKKVFFKLDNKHFPNSLFYWIHDEPSAMHNTKFWKRYAMGQVAHLHWIERFGHAALRSITNCIPVIKTLT
jgi:hypothetical protein